MKQTDTDYKSGLDFLQSSIKLTQEDKKSLEDELSEVKSQCKVETNKSSEAFSGFAVYLGVAVFVLVLTIYEDYLISRWIYHFIHWLDYKIIEPCIHWFYEWSTSFLLDEEYISREGEFQVMHLLTGFWIKWFFYSGSKTFLFSWLYWCQFIISIWFFRISAKGYRESKTPMKTSAKKWKKRIKDLEILIADEDKKIKKKEKDMQDFIKHEEKRLKKVIEDAIDDENKK